MVNLDSRNSVAAKNVYPKTPGATTATRASAGSPYSGVGAQGSGDAAQALTDMPAAVSGGALGKPFSWWFVLVAMLVALMYAAQRFGSQSEEFRTIRLSVYNVLVIALSATIGIAFFKVVFSRWQVPGLTPLILAV